MNGELHCAKWKGDMCEAGRLFLDQLVPSDPAVHVAVKFYFQLIFIFN